MLAGTLDSGRPVEHCHPRPVFEHFRCGGRHRSGADGPSSTPPERARPRPRASTCNRPDGPVRALHMPALQQLSCAPLRYSPEVYFSSLLYASPLQPAQLGAPSSLAAMSACVRGMRSCAPRMLCIVGGTLSAKPSCVCVPAGGRAGGRAAARLRPTRHRPRPRWPCTRHRLRGTARPVAPPVAAVVGRCAVARARTRAHTM